MNTKFIGFELPVATIEFFSIDEGIPVRLLFMEVLCQWGAAPWGAVSIVDQTIANRSMGRLTIVDMSAPNVSL